MPGRPLRSVLYVPASNEKALAKVASLACDAVILDLEDAVAPEAKADARERLRGWFRDRPAGGPLTVIRINPLASEWGTEDLLAARACQPDAILLPKIDTARDILEVDEALDETDAPAELRLWIMVETARCLLNAATIAELGRDRASRLSCLVAGSNDLAKETGVTVTPDHRYLVPWLMQLILAGRAGGLTVLDGVSNDFSDIAAFSRECAEAAAMGFDGKTLIHPAQISPANAAFSPSADALAEARRVVEAFDLPENAGKGVISLGGRMVERLHLAQAERLLARADTPASAASRR